MSFGLFVESFAVINHGNVHRTLHLNRCTVHRRIEFNRAETKKKSSSYDTLSQTHTHTHIHSLRVWDIRILVASPTLIAVIPSQNRYLLAYCYPVWYTMPTANNRNACNKWKWAIPRNHKTIDAKPQSMAMQISSTKRMMFRHYMVVRRLGFFFLLLASLYL